MHLRGLDPHADGMKFKHKLERNSLVSHGGEEQKISYDCAAEPEALGNEI